MSTVPATTARRLAAPRTCACCQRDYPLAEFGAISGTGRQRRYYQVCPACREGHPTQPGSCRPQAAPAGTTQ